MVRRAAVAGKWPRCERCGKIAYPTRQWAVQVAWSRLRRGQVPTLRIYACPWQPVFHLTKKVRPVPPGS